MWAPVVLVGVLGLAIGSFLNVVVWRVPRGESVVSPPSACPRCGVALRRRDNVPVVSWLLLRGRCHSCGEPISRRYPLVEAGTAAVFCGVALRLGWSWGLPAYLYLAAVGVALALIDLDVRRLPNAIVLPSYPVVLALLTLASLAPGRGADWSSLLRAGVGGAVLFGFYFLLVLLYPRGMGWGDVKLAGLLGMGLAWLGWGSLIVGGFAAFLAGGVFSLALLAAGKASRKTAIPFGPWMILGAAVGFAVGEPAWTAYLSLLG